jgi:vitamin B12 transporter
MKQRLTKGLLMTALITGSVLCGSVGAFAEELDEYSLDQVIVTATRTEKKDLETPAIVEVYDAERIEKSNAGNAYDVLQNTLGLNTQAQGFNGTGMGTMTSKVMIRGVEKGTLVLVNGVPMNMDGKYNLEDIPTESIEKIEVVKGGGSVLYGSEATGGVINIITKKKMVNKVKVAAGNFGKERYDVSVGAGKFNIVAGYENRGYADKMSGVVGEATSKTTVYDYGKGERRSVLWNWELTDGLTFIHSYSKNKHQYWQKRFLSGERTQNNYYTDTDNMFLLQYDKDGWKANLSYGTQEKTYDQAKFTKGVLGAKSPYSARKGHNTNIDLQKSFDIGKNKLLVGTTFQREDMDALSASKNYISTYERNNYSIYASYDWQLTDKSNLVFNARETWATACEGKQTSLTTGKTQVVDNDNLSKFTPEVQYILKLSENSSFYAKAGKSFRLPNLTQIYGTGNINPSLNLKPEQGTHFEVGYKANIGKADWRLAVFNYKIKDSIDADVTYNKDGSVDFVDYFNENVRNTGIELSCAIAHDDNWSSHWGVTYQNPQAQNVNTYDDNAWHSIYNRYQLQGGVDYTHSKFASSMSVNFVGDRTSTKASSDKPVRSLKPQCFTDLHFTYAAEKNQKAFLHINNIFDRLDITSNSTSNFYSLGRNFMVGYEYSF